MPMDTHITRGGGIHVYVCTYVCTYVGVQVLCPGKGKLVQLLKLAVLVEHETKDVKCPGGCSLVAININRREQDE